MRSIVLASAVLFSASTCFAQTTAPQEPATSQTATQPTPDVTARQAGPANICQELLAFMTAPDPDAPAPEKPAAAASTQAAPAAAAPDAEADGGDSSSALAGTTDTQKTTAAEAGPETNSAQEITGQEGVATDAPSEESNQSAASGSVEDAPQKESRAAPVPPADVTSTPRESVLTVEAAEQLASANDLGRCQEAAREMRVAGVDMPPPLISLAALDLRYQQGSAGENAPVANDEPATNE